MNTSGKYLYLSFILLYFSFSAIAQDKKNILFIAVDDLKPTLGCYGDELVVSPNIDKLAEQGTVFLNNHCQQAVCAPSRASLLTGLRPDNTKVWDLKTIMRNNIPDVLTLPQHFRQNGYETVAFGKIFDQRSVDKEMDGPSWSIPYNSVNNFTYGKEHGIPYSGRWQLPSTKQKALKLEIIAEAKGKKGFDKTRYALQFIKPSTEIADVPDEAYPDGQSTTAALEIMGKLVKNKKQFFVAVGYKKPHLPFSAPKKYWDLYNRNDFKLSTVNEKPVGGPEIAMHKWQELKSYSDIGERIKEDGSLKADKQRELIHGYYACVSYIDAQIGKLLKGLEEFGIKENTIIVLWGDHGWHLGDHGLWCKHSNYEQATRSPLIISDPGIGGNTKTDSPTEFIDIFPTLTELAGLSTPATVQGKSLVPIMTNQADEVKEYAVSQYPRGKDIMGYALRTKRYRYVEWHKNSYISGQPYDPANVTAIELYDYKIDPLEKRNLINDKNYKKVKEELGSKMRIFLEKGGKAVK